MQKCHIPKTKFSPWVPTQLDLNILDPTTKFKIWICSFSRPSHEVSKKVCNILVEQKTQTGDRVSRHRVFWPSVGPCRLADLTPPPPTQRVFVYSLTDPENLINILLFNKT